jgi:hypothetical protein
MNKQQALIITLISLAVVIVSVVAVQSNSNFQAFSPKDSANSTQTPTPTVPTPQPTVVATREVEIKIESVGIRNATAASVYASSQTGLDVVIVSIILKDDAGNTLASDGSIHQTLPANGESTEVTINQHNVDFSLGGTFTLTLGTENGNTFTSPSRFPPFYQALPLR